MTRLLHLTAAIALAALPALAGDISSSVDPASLPGSKTTALGLYLTPQDADAALQADPSIVFLDVRDPVEIAFVGHPQGVDAIVPIRLATHRYDAAKGTYAEDENPEFLTQAEAAIARAGGDADSPVFVICRSGSRSASAANTLADAGYTNVWNIVEGFEGDKDDAGARSVNGWRNAGLPWTYRIAPEEAWRPGS